MVQIIENWICKKCNTSQQVYLVSNNREMYRECINCKDKEVISKTTHYSNSEIQLYIDMSQAITPEQVNLF